MNPQELKSIVGSGLLSFPLTDFDAQGDFNARGYAERLEWLAPYGASALFAAGGTGEYFSLSGAEYSEVVRTAVTTCRGKVPIIAGAGGPTRTAIAHAQEAERLGAHGVLLLPHYLTEASQAGLIAHVEQVCKSVDFGVIVYNRNVCKLTPDSLAILAERCPNLIGFKDGTGKVDLVRHVTAKLGDRLCYIGGMPTHELFAEGFNGVGVTTYSSAVFNFVPELAQRFYRAMRAGDRTTMETILHKFFFPFAALRDRKAGYPVSIIKAGVDLVGYTPGPVRAPLVDLTGEEREMLHDLIKGAQG